MLRRDPNFRKLPGGGRGLARTSSYWLGSDYLLAVYVEGYLERYRRFYYRDIQAIVLRKTRRRALTCTALGLLTVGALGSALTANGATRIALFVSGGLLLIAIIVNVVRGPTCVCHLRTAVQMEKLTGMNRLRTARRAIALLTSRIDAAQAAAAEPTVPNA